MKNQVGWSYNLRMAKSFPCISLYRIHNKGLLQTYYNLDVEVMLRVLFMLHLPTGILLRKEFFSIYKRIRWNLNYSKRFPFYLLGNLYGFRIFNVAKIGFLSCQ